MQADVLRRLSQITEEEQYILVQENPSHRSLYAKSGRFIIERRHISQLSFGESTAAICLHPHPRFRGFPSHSHDFIEIMYVCNGAITHVIGDQSVRLETDDIILLGKDTRHSILSAGQDDIGINLIISTDLFETLLHSLRQKSQLPITQFERLLQRDGLPFCVYHASESIAVRNLLESMIASVICEKKANGYILQQSLALLLCYLAEMNEQREAPQIEPYEAAVKQKILNYIQTSYSTATLTEAASMLRLSSAYLSRLTSKSFGKSFKELLMDERFAMACELLSSTELSIGEIINQIGYENSSYFHKEFKARYGMTPSEYRKQG